MNHSTLVPVAGFYPLARTTHRVTHTWSTPTKRQNIDRGMWNIDPWNFAFFQIGEQLLLFVTGSIFNIPFHSTWKSLIQKRGLPYLRIFFWLNFGTSTKDYSSWKALITLESPYNQAPHFSKDSYIGESEETSSWSPPNPQTTTLKDIFFFFKSASSFSNSFPKCWILFDTPRKINMEPKKLPNWNGKSSFLHLHCWGSKAVSFPGL